MIDIPEGWQQFHWKQQVALANELFPEKNIKEASQARGAVEQEVRRRQQEASKPAIDMPKTEPGVPTLMVFLDYDVWIGSDERVRKSPDVAVAIPRELAKKFLAEGKARRGDPLPD